MEKMECSSGPSSPRGRAVGEEGKGCNNGSNNGAASHSEAVQALRKYLMRKMSSEESSGDKELEFTTERVISVAESNGSKLYCSLVQRPPTEAETTQGNRKCLSKHKSLDLDHCTLTHTPTGTGNGTGSRYLRTDLCVPVLWSKCSFCDDFFENEEHLRKHLRESHYQYFSNYIQMRPLTSTKSLSDLPLSSALKIRDPPNNSQSQSSMLMENEPNFVNGTKTDQQDQVNQLNISSGKKPVRCEVCGKGFTTKWNCKQHFKCHMKEICPQTEADS